MRGRVAPRAVKVDSSQRHMMARAAMVGLLMRNGVNVLVALIGVTDLDSAAHASGKWVLVAVGGWSVYRLWSRSDSRKALSVDIVVTIVVALCVPVLAPDPQFYSYNTVPQAIAGTAVVSLSVSMPATASGAVAAAIAAAYACGSAGVLGWQHIGSVAALYYFLLQWLTASLIRIMLLQVAAAVDAARATRVDAEAAQQVEHALRDFDREQLALLHDTAASTLLIAAQASAVPAEQLAAQAQRDIQLLSAGPWVAPPAREELVSAIRRCATHLTTPVRFRGKQHVWVDGRSAQAVVAATREVLNNVDRHAHAGEVVITIVEREVTLTDNGIGFDPTTPRTGHGLSDSIQARMLRAGGGAAITSAPGLGTSITLRWGTPAPETSTGQRSDPDRFIERTRIRYGLALTVYALANLGFAIPHALLSTAHVKVDLALGIIAAASTLAALPGIIRGHWRPAVPAAAALLVVAVAQPMTLEPSLVGGYAHWAQNAIGWCALPLLLGLPVTTGAPILVGFWAIGSATELACNPTHSTLVNIGLGTASILAVQLFALTFNQLVANAAADAQTESTAYQQLTVRSAVEANLRQEYLTRYAELVTNIVAVLTELANGAPANNELRRRALAESRRMRALFDQAATFDHPLLRSLRPAIDAAESEGIDVVTDFCGPLPPLSADSVDTLVHPIRTIMAGTRGTVRLVIHSTASEVSVSLVCRGGVSNAAQLRAADNVEIIDNDTATWVLVRHQLAHHADKEHTLAG